MKHRINSVLLPITATSVFCLLFTALGGNCPDNINRFSCLLVSSGSGQEDSEQEVREGYNFLDPFLWGWLRPPKEITISLKVTFVPDSF